MHRRRPLTRLSSSGIFILSLAPQLEQNTTLSSSLIIQLATCRAILLNYTLYYQYNETSTRGGAVWQLVGLITRRSEVRILPPLPSNANRKSLCNLMNQQSLRKLYKLSIVCSSDLTINRYLPYLFLIVIKN